jgi:hypothetical protein
MQSLKDRIDIGQFLNYVNGYGFTNDELGLVGQNLTRSVDGESFCRNAALMFTPEQSEYLALALANSAKKGGS